MSKLSKIVSGHVSSSFWSIVSKFTSLVMCSKIKMWLTYSLRQWVTRSPIELSTNSKKHWKWKSAKLPWLHNIKLSVCLFDYNFFVFSQELGKPGVRWKHVRRDHPSVISFLGSTQYYTIFCFLYDMRYLQYFLFGKKCAL